MFILAMALAAQDLTEYVEGWTVSSNLQKSDCAMTATFMSGGDVSFHWRPRKRTGVMLYRSSELNLIEQNREYTIEVGFSRGGQLDMGWGKRSATGNVSRDGTHGFMVVFSGEEILTDLAASDKLGFWYKGKLVGSVPLDGSGKAIAALRRCENAVLRQSRDPFDQ